MQNKYGLKTVLGKIIRGSGAMTFLMLVLIIGAVVSALFPPLVLEKIVNCLTAGQGVSLLMAIEYFALIAVSGVMESGQNVMITVFGQKVTHGLRSEMCDKLRRLPAAYYTANEAGKITSRFVNDVDTIDTLFTDGIIGMFADACKIVSILAVIFWLSRGLGILLLIVTPLLFLMTRAFQKKMLDAQMENRVAVAKVNNHVPETIQNIRMIHTLFRQKYMERRYDEYIQESYRATDKTNLYDSVYSPIIIFTGSCVTAVMMICAAMGGGMREFFGVSVGTAVAMISYVSRVFDPLESIGMEIQSIQSAVAGVKRMNEFLREEERPEAGKKAEDGKEDAGGQNPEDGIRFSDVTFRYGTDQPVFEHLDFTVAKGEHVTFVGRTGAGKSTVFRLLLGLYVPEAGNISVFGTKALEIPDGSKRKLFGYVEQKFSPVNGSVAEQISLYDPEITGVQIQKAAELTGLHEVITALPKGYDTQIADATFSQGQYQLLSIARAVAAQPQILLLDEITADLDSDTEKRVLEALERAGAGRTVLSISHRLQEYTGNQRLITIGQQVVQ
ncbi:MAG: ABC transporter ATP-binding protein/permease [Butyrivibrio sp.]|jgi:ABC-type multidrug transport system fused ATPase/permease subunit|nr:ABC transporter ATP-binding protein/permease [Butyrivibrio sp.]